MAYWLVKSEPEAYSWSDLQAEGEGTWDGVRNYQARNFLREMAVDDRVLFYHSGRSREIVGVARVTQAAYPDPTTEDDRWVAVSLVGEEKLPVAVGLDQVKAEPELGEMLLVKQPRLSVMAVEEAHFKKIIQLSREANP